MMKELNNISVYNINFKGFEGKYLIFFTESQLQNVTIPSEYDFDVCELRSITTVEPVYFAVCDTEEEAIDYIAKKNEVKGQQRYSEEGDTKICCDCPNLEHNGNAKCTACRDTHSNEKQRLEVSDVLKKEIQKLNEGLFWMVEGEEKRVSVREIIELRNILEKAYYFISKQTKGKD